MSDIHFRNESGALLSLPEPLPAFVQAQLKAGKFTMAEAPSTASKAPETASSEETSPKTSAPAKPSQPGSPARRGRPPGSKNKPKSGE